MIKLVKICPSLKSNPKSTKFCLCKFQTSLPSSSRSQSFERKCSLLTLLGIIFCLSASYKTNNKMRGRANFDVVVCRKQSKNHLTLTSLQTQSILLLFVFQQVWLAKNLSGSVIQFHLSFHFQSQSCFVSR